jgi:hypothetical protein
MKVDFSKMSKKILYHGTTNDQFESLQQGIDLTKSKDSRDFGRGFYTTTIPDQAVDWANNQAERYNTKKRLTNFNEQVKPLVLHFKVDYEKLSHLEGYAFEYPSDEWANFVYNNRRNVVNSLHNIDLKFDFVYGSLADGKDINGDLDEFHNGIIDIDELRIRLFPYTYANNQLSFHSTEAVSCLKLVNYNIPINQGGLKRAR